MEMESIRYERIRRRSHSHGSARCRGFRLNLKSRRFSVVWKVRAKLVWLLRRLNRWRRSIKKGGRSKAAEFPIPIPIPRSSCADQCRLSSFRRSNSFYAQAIADCLDFIKTSSSSLSIRTPSPPTLSQHRHPPPSPPP